MDGAGNQIMPRPIDYMEPSFASSVADETSVHYNIDNLIYENDRDKSFNKFADILQNYEINKGRVNPISTVPDIFDKTILKQLWKEKGAPFINLIPGAGRSEYKLDERTEAYSDFSSKTHPVDTMNIYLDFPVSNFVAELGGHADQYKRRKGESLVDWKIRRMNMDEKAYIEEKELGDDAYQTPGAQEWDAHKIRQEESYEQLSSGFNLSGRDSLYQRMQRNQWDLWKDELKRLQNLRDWESVSITRPK
jgi:hypothetical protein